MNPYGYARNNPYKFKDDNGNFLSTIVGVIVIGIVVISVALWGIRFNEVKDKPLGSPERIDVHAQAIEDVMNAVMEGVPEQGILLKESLDAKSTLDLYNKLQEDKEKSEEDNLKSLCKDCKTRYIIDNRGNTIVEVINNRGETVSRYFGGGGGSAGSTVMPDPSGRKDRFGNPIYVPKPPKPKSTSKPKKH